MKGERFLTVLILLALALSSIAPVIPARAAPDLQADPQARARAMLAGMTPEERIGQLFLVSFSGTSVDEDSPIYDLIVRHHVGGVILLAENDNFLPAPDSVSGAYQLVSQLQSAEYQSAQSVIPGANVGEASRANYVPLFVGITQMGDGAPSSQILSGLTPLPSQMSIGATWDPALAEQVGTVSGQELAAIGFNLVFGPSLDVLESPEASQGSDLGANVFGGDPYWVGELGSSYVSGLHAGGNGELLVIATHFPGRGSADRPVGEEVATVRKSLEQLKQMELAPFFTVTGEAETPGETVDGLLVSHIRYQGFQGNIRATTRPVSFDAEALAQIMALPAFASWRAGGGLVVSDDLGSQTVRRFYDPGGQSFSARLVARDAFLAGNDLLYLGNIISNDAPDNYTTVLRILDFFIQKYREDPTFAQRVDEAVVRILAAKYRLYSYFTIASVTPSQAGLEIVGQSSDVTRRVAGESATLISPNRFDLVADLPTPPGERERIVFLTDTRTAQQCSTCLPMPMLAQGALQSAILRLYGPAAGDLVSANRLYSYSFDDLSRLLDGDSGNNLEGDLRSANWIVISMLDAGPGQRQSALLRRFLSERQDLLRNKRVVVFAFNVPYILDATDISKLTAYYALYSKSEPFVDTAARLLFQELSPLGSPPVSVPGIGYDLLSATAPNPEQVIQLTLELPAALETTPAATSLPTPTHAFRVGDAISVQTGTILDHNGNPVPDGTGVRFELSVSGESVVLQTAVAETAQGVARASFSIDRPGLLEIRARSEPALTSVVLQLDVSSEGVDVIAVAPTATLETSVPTQADGIPPGLDANAPYAEGRPGLIDWVGMVAVLAGLGLLVYWLVARLTSPRWGLRWAFCCALGGLAAYNYLALGLPGGAAWVVRGEIGGILGVVFAGGLVGVAACWIWWRAISGSVKRQD
ncbi:MAG: hypothetical protein JXB85_09060 [Anaerolineales bacterium]|nr:hypothetical protein [Anaerolineales bacterium]